jgi:uncharacterized YigZ family protein
MELTGDTYLSIEGQSEGLFKDKGSKFIAYAVPIETEEQAKQALADIKNQHKGARHFCYAYRLGKMGLRYRASDDGEPSSTAGKPILGQLVSKSISDAIIIVVRYFGGTLLGAGGLINAYRKAAADALDAATVTVKTETGLIEIKCGYPEMSRVLKYIANYRGKILRQDLGIACSISASFPASATEAAAAAITSNTKAQIIN